MVANPKSQPTKPSGPRPAPVVPTPPSATAPSTPPPPAPAQITDVPVEQVQSPPPAAPTPTGDVRARLAHLARRLHVPANQFYQADGFPIRLADGRVFDLYLLANVTLDRLDRLEDAVASLQAQLTAVMNRIAPTGN
jgi:hypothetical protein